VTHPALPTLSACYPSPFLRPFLPFLALVSPTLGFLNSCPAGGLGQTVPLLRRVPNPASLPGRNVTGTPWHVSPPLFFQMMSPPLSTGRRSLRGIAGLSTSHIPISDLQSHVYVLIRGQFPSIPFPQNLPHCPCHRTSRTADLGEGQRGMGYNLWFHHS